jgi:hypothetical protein
MIYRGYKVDLDKFENSRYLTRVVDDLKNQTTRRCRLELVETTRCHENESPGSTESAAAMAEA